VRFKSPYHAQLAGIMIVHQEFSLVPYMSVADNILLGLEECGALGMLKTAAMRKRARQALEMVNLQLPPDALIVNLSAGQQKLVEIAKALAAAPALLVVDEPTAPLTKRETAEFFRTLKRLKQKGTTVIYISHHLEEIFQIADRVTVLKDGKEVSSKAIGDTNIDDVIRMMIGRELGDMFPEKKRVPKEGCIMSIRNLARKGELFDINFDLRKGEILGIAGLQGQGQDILLRTIFGTLGKNSGTIIIDDKPVRIESPSQAISAGMALVTDKRAAEGLCPLLSVRDNLALSTLAQRQRFGLINEISEDSVVGDTIAELNIQTPSLDKLVKFLSGGNQQKIVVGKWLIADPRILLFINPTAGIDVGAKTEFYRQMRRFTDCRDIGIVMVTSDMLELLGLCDRLLVMYRGRIVSELHGKDATEEQIMRAAVGRADHQNNLCGSKQAEEDPFSEI
jgi:ribose transport system ATP-binding protein